MLRVFVISLLVAVASAADNDQIQNNDPELQKLTQTLKLNQDEVKLAAEGESATADHLAFEAGLGLNHDQLSCKSIIVDKKQIKFTLMSMPTENITWDATQNVKLIPYFDPELPTQILISGRLQSEKVFQPAELAFTYGIRGNKMNVISVNWDSYSSCSYLKTVFFIVPQVASVVGDMIKNTLVAQNEMDYNKLRLTGFGMGAHVAGLAARKLPQKPARITALDPAGRLYNILGQHLKLKKGDAKFLDVIMTNRGAYGMQELIGDINFLPSGGRMQKACENLTYARDACSHHLALEYYVESVNKGSSGFVAKPSNSWTDFLAQKSFIKYSEIMGEGVSQKKTGNFYLEVNAQSPYSRGVNGAYLFVKASEEPTQKESELTQSTQNVDSQNDLLQSELQSQLDLSQQGSQSQIDLSQQGSQSQIDLSQQGSSQNSQ